MMTRQVAGTGTVAFARRVTGPDGMLATIVVRSTISVTEQYSLREGTLDSIDVHMNPYDASADCMP